MTPADKQEPVAWMYERPNHNYPALGPHRVLNPVRWSEEAVAEGWTETPLYTRPTPDLAERIEGFAKALKNGDFSNVDQALNSRLCCDGYMCGCRGSTVGEYLAYELLAALKEVPHAG